MAHTYLVDSISADNEHLIQIRLDKFSSEGWRLHSIMPIAGAYGGTRNIKMIFEKVIPVESDGGPR